MNNRRTAFLIILSITAIIAIFQFSCTTQHSSSFDFSDDSLAKGVVYHDKNINQIFDSGDKLLSGIRVSNGQDIVLTDSKGRYALPYDEETIFFVIKPEGWRTLFDENNLPQFYYIHQPDGSPDYKYPGIQPTEALPDSINFPLYKQQEPSKFEAILFGDTQTRNQQEIDYIAHDVVEELIGYDASFGITLGDLVYNDLTFFNSLTKTIGLIGIPWYNVSGNHDINFDSPDDFHSNETFKSVFGPPYYSFDYGKVHFIVLDDIEWTGDTPEKKGSYRGGLDEKQMNFIRNDLALISEEQMVVLFMHIPLTNVNNRQDLYRLIESRPFSLSISGHTHTQEHRFITREDGWQGPEPHHHFVNVTVCGSWWQGAPDERGIPHATMSDGAPNGYSFVSFDGHSYDIAYKAAGYPADYQMNIFAPEEITVNEAGLTEIVVNVFAGSERSRVEMRLGDTGEWITLTRVTRQDPYFLKMKVLEQSQTPPPGRKLPMANDSDHIWQARLAPNPEPGTHLLHVRTTDMFGKTFTDFQVIRILKEPIMESTSSN